QKKLFEQAVNQKLQEEMSKLQAEFNKQLKQSKPAARPQTPPVLTASMAPQQHEQQVPDDRAPSAAALDERRVASRQEAVQPAQVLPQTTTQSQSTPVQLQPQVQQQPQPQPAPEPVAPAIKEGDLVTYEELDVKPAVISRPNLSYPPLAMRQRVQTLVILSVLVAETGQVQDVRILRGDSRFGFNDEAVRLLRATRFRPPMKDGKRVKTWL